MAGDTVQLSAEDKKWRAESDARTLAEAEDIKGDAERLKAAQTAAAEQIANMSRVTSLYPTMNEDQSKGA